MDKILEAVLVSPYSNAVKHGLIRRVLEAAKEPLDRQQCWSMLEVATKLFLLGDTKLKRDTGKEVFEAYAHHHPKEFEEFFSVRFILNLLQEGYGTLGTKSLKIIEYLHLGLQYLLQGSSADEVFSLLQTEVLRMVCERPGPKFCAGLAKLLSQNPQCIPTGKQLTLFCQQLVRSIGQFQCLSEAEDDIMEFLDHVIKVSGLLQKIWRAQTSSILPSLKELFTIISTTGQETPSNALASVVQFVPVELMDGVIKNLTNDDSISDAQMMTAINSIFSCDKCIIEHCYLTLMLTVFSKLYYPIVREGTLSVLKYMLLSFQHSPDAFHMLLPHIPKMVAALCKEDPKSGRSCLEQLAELIHCMIFRFSGFPDLYEPLMEAIKDLPVPNEERVKQLLGQNAWTSQKNELAPFYPRLAAKSNTGRIGLVNLGNTCYMNSVLQALFMASDFRQAVMYLKESDSQPLMMKLQRLFAFLEHSQRPAISPDNFLAASWPPWFSPGAQQDCSEYLKYLLDRLHEEEKTGRRINLKLRRSNSGPYIEEYQDFGKTLIEKMFGGKLMTNTCCLCCHNISLREEAFTDLSLAFPPPQKAAVRYGGSTSPALPIEEIGPKSTHSPLKSQNRMCRSPKRQRSPLKSEQPYVHIVPIEILGSHGKVETERPTFSRQYTEELEDHDGIEDAKNSAIASGEQTHAADGSRSVPDLINFFLSPEMLTGDNKYYCEMCASLQDAEKVVEVSEAPCYLILTLLRFSFDLKVMKRRKIIDNVYVPLVLKLPVRVSGKESPHKPSGIYLYKKTKPAYSGSNYISVIYDLCSVVVHSGISSESGHYYCYAREGLGTNGEGLISNGIQNVTSESQADSGSQWYLFNDTRVSFSSFESVSNVTSYLPKDTAYVLFYRQRTSQRGTAGPQHTSGAVKQYGEPPLSKEIMEAISKDNIQYLQEQEREARNRATYIPALSRSPMWWRGFGDDDDNEGSSGSCGPAAGGGGSGSFSRLVF
nr:PREDICTED: ubiquitin carboxyl-terminal hydrolase 35 [Latimeria chalumnae]|eukprot:XP_014340498.1 PREDICTED: ubiquitin carboxyl-terminal hydrolase 35 [Latimeria chalumnae]